MIHAIAEGAVIRAGMVIVDIGCGNGLFISTLASRYGITGYAVDSDPGCCERATEQIRRAGSTDAIQVVCADATTWQLPYGVVPDIICALGVSHIWNGTLPTLEALILRASEKTSIILGDRYWRHGIVPHEYASQWADVQSEYAISRYAREQGYFLSRIERSTEQDWDMYESAIWQECCHWIKNHPDHPDTDDIYEYYCNIQDEYMAYGREHMGWALFLFEPFL